MEDKRIIITGCGYKPIRQLFKDLITGEPTHTEVIIEGERCKLNIGAAVALTLLKQGATVHMVSKTEEKLKNLKNAFMEITGCGSSQIEYSAIDLLNEEGVKEFVSSLPTDRTIYWVHSVGLGAGSYKVKEDNPYLPLEELDIGLIEAESTIVLRSTHLLMKEFLKIFKRQKESRVVIVSSMSAIRGYHLGGTHCAAKGAIDRYANAALLALEKENIFVTTIRPGIVDTGLYDSPSVVDAVRRVGERYGCQYENTKIPLAPPLAVGQIVAEILRSPAHIVSVNLVAKKQWPHEQS